VSTLALDSGGLRAGAPRSRLLGLERRSCEAIGWREFGLRHSLAGHPLLSLEALAQLADALPARAVERHEAWQPLLVPGGCAELADPPSATVRTIETNGRWMVLWNIEQVVRYRRLLDDILDEAAPLLPPREGGMGRREAFLFLSSPNAITPVHFDPEHNFLLQIRGVKELRVGRFPDRRWELRELDRYHDGGHRNLEKVPPKSSVFQLLPGDGAYLYPWVPHWVYNGPAASVSLSITFRTRRSERIELAHTLNARLRKRGWAPTPAGQSAIVDEPKAALMRLTGWLRRRGRPQRGARDYS
jgi:hypothetical protein